MKRVMENITGNYTASASVVDGTLIISLPDALNPVVWRLDLGQARASAIEVRERDGGTFMLTLKTPRGDVNDIAAFSTRGKAVTALMAVSRAMEQSRGQTRGVANDPAAYTPSQLPVPVKSTARRGKGGKNILAGLVAVVLIVILLGTLMSLSPVPSSSLRNASPAAGNAAMPGQPPSGVPVSADDFLQGR